MIGVCEKCGADIGVESYGYCPYCNWNGLTGSYHFSVEVNGEVVFMSSTKPNGEGDLLTITGDKEAIEKIIKEDENDKSGSN
jgi:hypothetical protein